MSQQRRPHQEAGLGQLGGALMMATHAGQNVSRNLARHRYAPAQQPQCRPQPQAQRQARPQVQPQPQIYISPTDSFNFRLSLLTGQHIPIKLPREQK